MKLGICRFTANPSTLSHDCIICALHMVKVPQNFIQNLMELLSNRVHLTSEETIIETEQNDYHTCVLQSHLCTTRLLLVFHCFHLISKPTRVPYIQKQASLRIFG